MHQLKIVTFGKNKKSDFCVDQILKTKNSSNIIIKIKNKKINFEIQDLNIYNVLASFAVLSELGLNLIKIKSKLQKIRPSDGRGKQHIVKRYKKKFKFIDESYNANPLSVKNAISRLNLIKKGK